MTDLLPSVITTVVHDHAAPVAQYLGAIDTEWERIFANPMATAAAGDRVVYHSVILEFDVPSYRTDAAQQRSQEQEVNQPE